eukprot:UN26000
MIDEGLSERVNITGLLAGYGYKIYIRAVNKIGVSDWKSFSTETNKNSVIPNIDSASLSYKRPITDVNLHNTSWEFEVHIDNDGGSSLTHINFLAPSGVQVCSSMIDYNRSYYQEKWPTLPCRASNLNLNIVSNFSVSLCNKVGCSPPTRSIYCALMFNSLDNMDGLCTRPVTKPEAPKNIKIISTYPNLVVEWDKPARDNDDLTYDIQMDDFWTKEPLKIR